MPSGPVKDGASAFEAPGTERDVKGEPYQGDHKYRADATIPKAGVVGGGIQETKRRVDHIEEKRPAAQAEEPISDQGMEGRRLSLGQHPEPAGRLGAENRQCVSRLSDDDVQIGECRDEKEQ